MEQSSFERRLDVCTTSLRAVDQLTMRAQVVSLSPLAAEIAGLEPLLKLGDRFNLRGQSGACAQFEIVGFQSGYAQAMSFESLDGIGPSSEAEFPARVAEQGGVAIRPGGLAVSDGWLGRVIGPLGEPLDGRGPLPAGAALLPTRRSPPAATSRARLGERIALGVRALDLFTTCRQGQRLGLFAGSGVGKSTLLAMLARQAACDVVVLGLVGERGREVREFVEEDLGRDALARSIVVVATSDAPPLARREAAYAAMTVAEYFRDQGKTVLLLMDSVTRFCLALREIALSAGEPPATRGYPPSVFAELPRLLERAGPGPERVGGAGHITALFTVLVEGDDHNEPVSDAVRGILDGHVVLDRRIAEGGRYPAIDVPRSLSRTVPGCLAAQEATLVRHARKILAMHGELIDLVRLGAFKPGADAAADEAVLLGPRLEQFLCQERGEFAAVADSFAGLGAVLAAGAAAT